MKHIAQDMKNTFIKIYKHFKLHVTRYMLHVVVFVLLTTYYVLLTTALPAFAEELPNPLGTKSITTIIGRVVKTAFGLAGSIALIIFIWGGFLWITAHGDEKQVKSGWETLTWGALGIIVIFGSAIAAEQVLKIFGVH